MKKQYLYFGGFAFLSLLFVLSAVMLGKLGAINLSATVPALYEEKAPVIVIDPGHGGEDGGCVSADGIMEKELNLAISEKVCAVLRAAGYNVEMTRGDDRLLYDMYDDRTDYKGFKKVYDLKNRLRFTNEKEAAVFVGLHMNKFTCEKYSGLQVYYSKNNDGSKGLAETIRTYNNKYLQPENTRATKPAGTNIYLLNRLTMPSVLVECGFLSNAEETKKLSDNEYQKQLGMVIASAIAEYTASIR